MLIQNLEVVNRSKITLALEVIFTLAIRESKQDHSS